MNWQVGYDPEQPEKFPNWRREGDDDEEGGARNAPWARGLTISHKYGLDGSYYGGRYQTYAITQTTDGKKGEQSTKPGESRQSKEGSKGSKGGKDRETDRGQQQQKEKEGGSKPPRKETSDSKTSSKKTTEKWTLEVLILRASSTDKKNRELCLVNMSHEKAQENESYMGEDLRLKRADTGRMWMYPTSHMRGNKDRDKHDKESVLINIGIIMQKQTNLKPSTAKAKDLIVPRAHEGEEPPDYVHTTCYLYECTTEEMKDKRWGLGHETGGGAGNPENGTKDAV